jgi:hypothetical protein
MEFTRATALAFLELLVTLADQNAEVTAQLRSWARVGTLGAVSGELNLSAADVADARALLAEMRQDPSA